MRCRPPGNGKAYYRCRFPAEYAVTEDRHAKTVYVRECAVVPGLDQWIGQLLDGEHLDETCAALALAGSSEAAVDLDDELMLPQHLKDCEAKLNNYRALLAPRTSQAFSWEGIPGGQARHLQTTSASPCLRTGDEIIYVEPERPQVIRVGVEGGLELSSEAVTADAAG